MDLIILTDGVYHLVEVTKDMMADVKLYYFILLIDNPISSHYTEVAA